MEPLSTGQRLAIELHVFAPLSGVAHYHIPEHLDLKSERGA